MNKRFRILVPLLAMILLVAVPSMANAVVVPSGISSYANITLGTSWSSVTSANVQQMVNITESSFANLTYNDNLANFEYFYTNNGTVIPSWIESNQSGKLITWIKIQNTTTTTNGIALGFANSTANLLSSSGTSGIGEAPQLSSTYGQYDDGAEVFNFYDNFKGTTLNTSKWTNSGITYTVNNGFNATGTAASGKITSHYQLNPESIVEFYGALLQTNTNWVQVGLLLSGTNDEGVAFEGASTSVYGSTANLTSYALSSALQTTRATALWTIESVTSSEANFYINYGGKQTITTYFPPYPLNLSLIFSNANAQAYTYSEPVTIQYFLTRAYPPSGVMPTVTFGAVQTLPTVSLSISPNPSTYGQSVTLTATATPTTDTVCIDYPTLGTHLNCSTGTATYTYNAFALGVGTYPDYYANDTTSSLNSTAQTLTVNQNTSTTTALTNCTNGILPYSCTTTATITSHNNQLTATLYKNGITVGTTNTVLTDTISNTIGTYNYTFSTAGNTNYSSSSTTVIFSKVAAFYFQNTTSTYAFSSNQTKSSFYPYKLYTNNYTGITYTLKQSYGGTSTTISSNVSTISYIPPTNQPTTYYGNPTNPTGGVIIGNVIYTANTTLSQNLYVVGNITINSGAVLTTKGHWIVAQDPYWIHDNGRIIGGTNPNASGSGTLGVQGTSINTSYAGSGGGGGSGNTYSGSQGGDTTVAGGTANSGGATPSTPSLTQTTVTNFMQSIGLYLSSAGGGAGGSDASGVVHGGGGTGIFGVAIEACGIDGTGSISVNGSHGGNTGGNFGGGGGSGGGDILEVYGSCGLTSLTLNYTGGVGGAGYDTGGTGGAGLSLTYDYGNTQPINILSNGTYIYNLTETQGSQSVSLFLTLGVNMTDLNTSSCSTPIQYLPIRCNATWYVAPSQWYIKSSPAKTFPTKVNATSNATFQTNQTGTIRPEFVAYYSFTNFTLNLTNNPTVPSLGIINFNVTSSNTIPSFPNTRRIANVSTFDQQFQKYITANTTIVFEGYINNYSTITSLSFWTNISNDSNVIGLYIPQSNWTQANLPFALNNISTYSTALNHTPEADDFFPTTINAGTWQTYDIYLPNIANSSIYTFNIYKCDGYAATGYYMKVLTGATLGTATTVQTVKINQIPYSTPLQNAQLYAFELYDSNQNLIYTKPLAVYSLSITMNLPCAPINLTNQAPVINATCTSITSTNTLTCRGIDTQNYVSQWTLSVIYHPDALQTSTLVTNTITGSSFLWTYQLPNHTQSYYVNINASVGRNIDPIIPAVTNYLIFGYKAPYNPGLAYNAIFGILIFFVFLGVAYVNEGAALIGYPIIIIVATYLNIYQWSNPFIYGSMGLMVIAAVLLWLYNR